MVGEDWQATTIGALLERFGGEIKTGPFGTKLKAAEYSALGVPVISVGEVALGRLVLHERTPKVAEDVTKRMPEYLLQEGDIVFGRKGAVERSARVASHQAGWFLGSDGIRLRLSNKCDSRFIAYQFLTASHQSWIVQHATGTTMPSLNQKIIERIPVIVPPLHTQRAIAHILGTLDNKIELNRRMNETLEEIARAIFKSWFVDFDPVRAKADGRQPAGMDPATAALFPDSFEDSPLGKIPKGWKVGTLAHVADLNGWALSKSDKLDRIDYVEISEVMRGDISSIATYERGQEPSRARRRLRHGDTALSTVRPDRGAYFLCLDPSPSLIASTGFVVLTPRQAPWSFVYLTAARQEKLDELGRLADGGAYPAVRPEIVGALDVIRPSEAGILESFHRICEPLLLRVNANRREQRLLSVTRDNLLPKLLSGEIRVAESERVMGALV